MEFKEIVGQAVEQEPGLDQVLADEFKVSVGTIERWRSKDAAAHPAVQKRVTEFIQARQGK